MVHDGDVNMQLDKIINSIKMANEQLSAADKANEKHKKREEDEKKRYDAELRRARMQDLKRREVEKEKKKRSI
jgi:hypothetical protein